MFFLAEYRHFHCTVHVHVHTYMYVHVEMHGYELNLVQKL